MDYPNREGHWPFLPKDGSDDSRYDPDLTRPNPAYFAFIDSLIPFAASLGVTIWLTPTWGRYVNGGYYGSPILFDESTAYAYGVFLGGRYLFHPFIIGGDSDRYWNEQTLAHISAGKDPKDLKVSDYGAVFDAMARGVVDGEAEARASMNLPASEGYQTFITFHSAQGRSPSLGHLATIDVSVWLPSAPEASSSAQFPEADWLTLDVVQTGHHDSQPPSGAPSHEQDGSDGHAQAGAGNMPMWFARSSYVPVRKMYGTRDKQGNPRPVMDLEPHYENTHHFFSVSLRGVFRLTRSLTPPYGEDETCGRAHGKL